MTENQRNYLAALAGQKGTRLKDTDKWSVSKASDEIDRLKELPDAIFDAPTDEDVAIIEKKIQKIVKGINQWNLQ